MAARGSAQVLLPYQSAWKYLQQGNAPAAAWIANGFNDGGWLSGQGASSFGSY